MNTTTTTVDGNDIDIAATNVDSLVHQACDVRARLMKAMQCSGAMFDKNMQCVAFILTLKKEHAAMEKAYKQERDVLTNRIDSLVHIVELSQQKLASMTQALALKGLWKSMLSPYRHNFSGDVEKLDVIGGVALQSSSSPASSPSSSSSSGRGNKTRESNETDHAAVALCLLSAQFAKMIHETTTREELIATAAVADRTPGSGVFNALPAMGGRGSKGVNHGMIGSTSNSSNSSNNGVRAPCGEVILEKLLSKVIAIEDGVGAAHMKVVRDNAQLRTALQELQTRVAGESQDFERTVHRLQRRCDVAHLAAEPAHMSMEGNK